MSLNYVSANSLNNSIDRLSNLVSYTVPPTPARVAKTIVNNSNLVTSVSSGFPTAPIAGNALYFQGSGNRLGLQNATGSWGATSANSTDGGANGKLSFTNLGQYTVETFICWSGSGSISGQEGWYEAGSGGLAAGATSTFIYNAISGVSYGAQANFSLQRSTWYHIALTRFNNGADNIIQIWVNGTQLGTGTVLNQNYTGVDPFNSVISPYIGGGNGGSGFTFTGWMQEYRISNIRRYTANFTPTTVPFVNDANTVLLIHGSNPDVDDNSS